jgi:uncharacterized protein
VVHLRTEEPAITRAKRFAVCCVGALLVSAGTSAATADVRLADAVKKGDTAAVRTLLAGGIDVNAAQGDGATALHWAAYRDDGEAADLLIRSGANADVPNDVGITPLMLAAENGSAGMVARLLKAGANPNARLESGETVLMTASRAPSADAVRSLLAHGANPNAKESWRDQTALMWAVARRRPAIVRALIDGGADVHARTRPWWELVNPTGSEDGTGVEWIQEGGFTPLLFAAREGDLESASLLVAAGARVDDTAASGTSALVVAVHSGNRSVAAFLLSKGADANAADAGYSALHLAILRNDADIVADLLSHGADPNAPLERPTAGRRASAELQLRPAVVGATPFWIAARYGEPQIMERLAAAGADPLFVKTTTVPAIVQPSEVNGRPVPEPAGMTAMMAALSSENIRRRLLATTVPNAEEHVVLDAVRLTAKLGVDVNAADEDGDTALHRAAKLRFNSVVQFLVEQGARLDVRNAFGQTPLMIASAAAAGGRATADLLRKLGAKE